MTDFNLADLATELNNTKETGVSFSGQRHKWGSSDEAQPVVDRIEKCKNLMYLDLEGNTLGVDAAKSIGKALEKHPEFQKALWKDLFTGRLKNEIPEALKNMGSGIMYAGAQLTTLDCSDNALGPNGMVGLVDLLKSSSCFNLKELILNNCGLGIGGGKMLSEALLACHQKSLEAGTPPFSLRVFIAGRNRLENEGAKALAKVFATVKSLEEVVMPQNGIYHEGIRALSDSFKENDKMKVINLNDNTITAKGAYHLAEAFFFMQELKEINFGDCLLKNKGALLLADAIQDGHSNLESLNLGFNEIGADGGAAIVSAIKNKPNLQNITIDGNQFGNDGREIIRGAMQEAMNPDALGSLTEDESENEDDTEGDEEEEEEDEMDEVDVSTEDATDDGNDIEYVSTTHVNLEKSVENSFADSKGNDDSSICFVTEEELPNNIETFCNIPNPTLTMFNNLESSNKIEDFRNYLNDLRDDDYLIKLVYTILKCSALSEASKEALDITESLYKDVFEYAKETNEITRVRTFFLIQLGLLKSEDKTFKPAYNLQACRYAMRNSIEQKIFPDDIENTFKLFLEKFASD